MTPVVTCTFWTNRKAKNEVPLDQFKFARTFEQDGFCDFYALATKGLKWLTVSITLVGRIKLLWKQIDVPVVLVVNCIPKYTLLNKIERTMREIKVRIVFEMIDFQWGFNVIFMVPFSHQFNPCKCQRTSLKIHFMGHKNAAKRSEKYSENLHGPLKIPS